MLLMQSKHYYECLVIISNNAAASTSTYIWTHAYFGKKWNIKNSHAMIWIIRKESLKRIQTDLRMCVNIKNINVYPSLLFHYPKQISFSFFSLLNTISILKTGKHCANFCTCFILFFRLSLRFSWRNFLLLILLSILHTHFPRFGLYLC